MNSDQMPLQSAQIRSAFTDFFAKRGHTVVPSAPLIPPDDPTLLFTTAGMVQFKPLYAGSGQLPYSRACSVQKCLRAGGKGSDLENVGRTVRHHTFFEMLGNFSFGDYFKRDALKWAWEFSTQVVKLDPDRIYASVYEDDDEAWDIWTKEIGLPESRMVRLGAKDNFWGPAGETGACGPCSELYYDRGEKYGAGLTFQHATINDDDPGSRYLEFWNCVFPQFDQQRDGSRPLLKNKGVDTGMSLERLCCLVQNTDSLYTTDLMRPLVEKAASLMGVADYDKAAVDTQQAINVVVDHVRALTFVISEGILPGNEGRGYVMRRLLRRAARYARHAGKDQPFMENLVDTVIAVMGDAYPEITAAPDHVKKVIRNEEEAYVQTLGAGLARLENLFAQSGQTTQQLSGEDVFQLTATFGLPFDDILEIAQERGYSIDMESYKRHTTEHQSVSRQGGKETRLGDIAEYLKELATTHGPTTFLGYPEQNGPAAMGMLEDLIQSHLDDDDDDGADSDEASVQYLNFSPDDDDESALDEDLASGKIEDMESLLSSKEMKALQKGLEDIFGKGELDFDNDLEENGEFGDGKYPAEMPFSDDELLDNMENDDYFSGAYPVTTVPNILVHAIYKNGLPVQHASAGDEIAIVVDTTPFYAESGGQVADTGWMTEGNCRIRITDVQKSADDVYVHFGHVENGTVELDSVMDASIDAERRMDIMRNHTATHLLQGALKRVLGNHIAQQGSLVRPDYLRFDFANPEAVSQEQLQEIERMVNEQIMADTVLDVNWMSREDARQLPGIIAPFGEKYGQQVRVVDIPEWDTEFCGGTHLLATGEAGMFLITSESAVSSGVRRIEAVTGHAALELAQKQRATLKTLSEELKVPRDRIAERIHALQQELKQARKELASHQAAASSADAADVLSSAETVGGVKLVIHQFADLDARALREAYDALKSRQNTGLFALLGSVHGGKAALIAGATKDVAARGLSAGEIIKNAAQAVGGSGGGKPEMAQAGIKDAEKLAEALQAGAKAARAKLQA